MSRSSTSTEPAGGRPFSLGWGIGYHVLFLVLLLGAALLPRHGWPCASPTVSCGAPVVEPIVHTAHVCLSDCALVYYVILLGMLGGWLHGVSSMAAFPGVKRLDESGWAFYSTRPFVGGATALLVSFLLQSGIAGFNVPTELWRGQMALLAWAGVAGLASTIALRKTRDVLEALFRKSEWPETRQPEAPTPAPMTTKPGRAPR